MVGRTNRNKKNGLLQKVKEGVGYALLFTIALPVVLVGGTLQLIANGFTSGCRGGGKGSGKESGRGSQGTKFTPMRKGVKVHPY